jgi:hypothetical protein
MKKKTYILSYEFLYWFALVGNIIVVRNKLEEKFPFKRREIILSSTTK